jgi:EAL domain-containing protein (putative c-di-GMP-specific phosphodiesterase class I)
MEQGGDVAPGEVQRPFLGGSGRQTVLAGQPSLGFQPIVDLASGRLLGFEGLLRWAHPTEGIIRPQLLIPWAEANGDIVALGSWVLSEGCRQAMAWPLSVQLAVNCSLVQLRRGVASVAVADALAESGLPPDRLTIEVTEHSMSEEQAVAELRAIAALGVQLAVDDVGTSWNSIDVLRRLAVNTIKIDQSFVNGLESREGINRMVVQAVVHLAHSSGMATVAEGVESARHAAIVREFDCDAAQGYFFAPALDPENAAKLANVPDLRFPLEGPGWIEGDDWPFRGAHAESPPAGSLPPRDRGLEGINLVDLVLDKEGEPEAHPAPVRAETPADQGFAPAAEAPDEELPADTASADESPV